jgi:hypothetical protein
MCNVMAASFAAYATSFSVFFLLMQYQFSSVSALRVAVVFILAIFFKEFAKMQTSNDDGYFSSSGRMPPSLSMCMSLGVAVFCSLGLETLFIASLWISINTMEGLNQDIKMLIYIGSVMFAVMNLPIDLLFYWNCLRKWFKTNSDILSYKTGQGVVLKLFRGSSLMSSVFHFIRTVIFSYYFFPGFAWAHPMVFCFFSGLIACVVFRVNWLLMTQTIAETYRQVPVMQPLFPYFVFNHAKKRVDALWIHVMALVYSLLFALPSVLMFQEAHVFVYFSERGAMLGTLSVGCTLLFSYYRLNKNYLLRFYQTVKSPQDV